MREWVEAEPPWPSEILLHPVRKVRWRLRNNSRIPSGHHEATKGVNCGGVQLAAHCFALFVYSLLFFCFLLVQVLACWVSFAYFCAGHRKKFAFSISGRAFASNEKRHGSSLVFGRQPAEQLQIARPVNEWANARRAGWRTFGASLCQRLGVAQVRCKLMIYYAFGIIDILFVCVEVI